MKLTALGLAKVGYDLAAPFVVDVRLDPVQKDSPTTDPSALLIGQTVTEVTFKSVARILPKKRVSGLAEYQDSLVFVKLFYGTNARRYWQRELVGAHLLQAAGVPCAPVLYKGATADGDAFVIFFEALLEPHNLRADDQEDMLAAVGILAQLHNANLVQTDSHVFNFLRSHGQYFAIDADGIRRAHLLRQHFANLAMLLAQRPPTADTDIEDIWASYSTARGAYVNKMGSATLLRKLTTQQRRRRVRRYLKKTQRSCTEFVQQKSFTHHFLCDREYWQQLQRFMLYPEATVGEGTPLKLGNSSTVVRVQIEDQHFIVKRYNVKSLSHRVRRWFKKRARIAWRNGHHLAFLDIHTARPLALLETKWGWFNSVCYLVMPDVGTHNLGQVLSTDDANFAQVSTPTIARLQGLQAAGLAHGDLKATNFVVAGDDVLLIDYDAVRKGANGADIERFKANWQNQPDLLEKWVAALKQAGL